MKLLRSILPLLLLSFVAQAQAPIKDGAILAEFSVSDSTKVYFSQGNLQYQAKKNIWRFAEHQYDTIGGDNKNISPRYKGWIDLFCWGTSGWNSGANEYQPYSTSTNDLNYFPGEDFKNDLIGSYANADWGVYNKISNGGNQARLWRTLTNDEWYYLINTRANASSKKGVARVNGMNGLILLPDEWTLPDGIVFTSGVADGLGSDYYATVNSYTASEWAKLEANGAVFLPAAGQRFCAYVYAVGSRGFYWSSSAYSHVYSSDLFLSDSWVHACYLYFDSSYVGMGDDDRKDGQPVRLVQDVKK